MLATELKQLSNDTFEVLGDGKIIGVITIQNDRFMTDKDNSTWNKLKDAIKHLVDTRQL